MNRSFSLVAAFGLVFLFFLQLAGTLVESIYVLDLLNTRLDEKALGVLFFFTPVLLIPFYQKFRQPLAWLSFTILLFTRGMLPYVNTGSRVLAAGLGVFASLGLLFLLLNMKPRAESRSQNSIAGSAGLGLAIALSVLLRTLGDGLDYSLIRVGGWAGWLLALALGWQLTQLNPVDPSPRAGRKAAGVTGAVIAIFMVLTLTWFAFSAPAVIARWTEGSYGLIVTLVSLSATGWVVVSLARPGLMERIRPGGLLLWNLFFTLSLTASILVQRFPFPPTTGSVPVVVSSPSVLAQISLALMLLLFPVIFLDMRLFLARIQEVDPPANALIPGLLLGTLIMVILIFAQIFTNVWGYVEPVSPPFRGNFWLPFFVAAGLITFFAWRASRHRSSTPAVAGASLPWPLAAGLLAMFIFSALWAMPRDRIQPNTDDQSSLVVMTFNTQQSNDGSGERSFDRQLALIREVAPDVLALQESDSTRVSLNNNDYVRYFAEQLGYYSYYGPTTATGTYGTAILSKYPLMNTRTVFTYSTDDEIGTSEAEIEVDGRTITIYNVHPAGTDAAMLAFAKSLLERARDKPYAIALGDYNLRDYEDAYQLVDSVLDNAWVTMYPSEIGANGVDMSGENRIDHIFVSPNISVLGAFYVLPPESATDHPVHWAEVTWQD